jgi:carbonic anhydrase
MSDQHRGTSALSHRRVAESVATQDEATQAFGDVRSGNEAFAAQFHGLGLPGTAAKGLAIITCMDSRIDPLKMVGMSPGDVKILRNAGARVTDDVLRTLVLATYLLGVTRVLVVPHTRCRMVGTPEEDIHGYIGAQFGVDTRSIEFRTVMDQHATLMRDLRSIRTSPLLPPDLAVAGAVYDVDTGHLGPLQVWSD